MKDNARTLIASNQMDFSSWTSLIWEIEETSADDNSAISRVYESFLSEYPLCYGYWEKYANHKARFSVDQAVEVYEEAVKVATYSVNLWANYCSFGMQFYEDLDDVRRLYERGLTFVGKDYLCNNLWDQYLAFEHSHKQWSRLVDVYIRSLRFPTKKLHSYYQSFKKLVISLEEEIKYQNIWMDLTEGSVASELGDLHSVNDSRIRSIISFLLDQPAALYRGQTLKTILTIGEYFYRRSSEIDEKISLFESRIRRPYFHVKPLDSCQLQTWNHYLDFVETQEDFDWTVKLYERCLIPCANYPEFWVRYIELMEASGGREIATHAIERAVTTFLKRVPQFHEYCAKVKERIGDAAGARSSLDYSKTEFLPNFVDNINQQANMEKRLGNVGAAYSIYEKAIEMLKDKQDLRVFCLLHMHFARFAYVVTGDLGAAREVFIKGISRAPHCKSLFEGLITFMSIHGGTGEIGYVDSIVERAIVPESGVPLALSLTDRKDVSDLFLQFVDLCGTAHEVRKAWARHLKLFPPAEKATTNGPELLEKTKEITGAGDHDHKPGTRHIDREETEEDDAHSSKKTPALLEGATALVTKSHPAVASDSTDEKPDRSRLPNEEKEQSKHLQAIQPPTSASMLQQEDHSFSSLGPPASSARGEEDQTPLLPGCESHDDLRPSLESLSICLADEAESNPISPHRGNRAPQGPYEENKREVKTAQHRASTMPATPQSPTGNNCTPERNLPQEKVNTFEISQLPAEEAADPKYPQTSEWHYGGQPSELQPRLPGYARTPQHQQWQVPMQFQYPPYAGFNPQALPSQAYAYQPQFWQPNIQMGGQMQGQYQMTAAPGLTPWSMFWQPQSLPQSGVDESQHQLYQNHLHDAHGVSPELWHYYQQQLYYMQQLQQGSIQVQQKQEPGPQQKNAQLQHDPLRQQQQDEQHQQQHLQLNILQLRHLQNKMEMDHLQRQWQQQELCQAQDSHLQHHPQPQCQPDDSRETSPTQDSPKPRQDQVQQYVQHQSIQQKNQLILSHQEHQQQMYLQQQQVLLQQQQLLLLQQQQQQQQQQKQETGTLLDAKTSRDNYDLQILAPTRVAEEDGAVHPIPQPPSAPIQ